MKLSRLYTNDPELFPDIAFRGGFNVVFARVENPLAEEEDSHNLGKSFLIRVIDFALLGGIDKSHPFRKNSDRFGHLVFYLEVETPDGQFVTVRRAVTGRASIFVEVREGPAESLRELPDEEWTHQRLGVDAAKEIVNDALALTVIRPYPYRKGLGYFLRAQQDYDEVFRISKFASGNDVDWKPFMALLLGFDDELVRSKYEVERKIEAETEYLRRTERESGAGSEEYDTVQGQIELLESRIERARGEVNAFSFREVEADVTQDVVDQVEAEIGRLNETVYSLRYELDHVRTALESGLSFDLDEVRTVFEEAGIALGEGVTRSYEELVDFNRRLIEGRRNRLRELEAQIEQQLASIAERLSVLDRERQRALATLTEQRTFEKYRQLQSRLADQERELARLHGRLAYLDRAADIARSIQELQARRAELVGEIEHMVRTPPERYKAIRRAFAEYAEAVANAPALLSVGVNTQGNLDFRAEILDRSGTRRATDEGRGTSYLKMLCVAFDLALLTVYADAPFYHFVYHDGVFEGLDNRRKVRLLELVRTLCNERGIQYILTVIDSDVPRDSADAKVLFTDDEVIRELSDEGDLGRLFRGPAF